MESHRARCRAATAKTNERRLWATSKQKRGAKPTSRSTCPASGDGLARSTHLTVRTPPTENARWFAAEVEPHERSLRTYLRRVFPTLPDLDDLVQESYARLIRAKDAGRVSYAKAFLFTTARNAALDFFRRRKVVVIDLVADFGK